MRGFGGYGSSQYGYGSSQYGYGSSIYGSIYEQRTPAVLPSTRIPVDENPNNEVTNPSPLTPRRHPNQEPRPDYPEIFKRGPAGPPLRGTPVGVKSYKVIPGKDDDETVTVVTGIQNKAPDGEIIRTSTNPEDIILEPNSPMDSPEIVQKDDISEINGKELKEHKKESNKPFTVEIESFIEDERMINDIVPLEHKKEIIAFKRFLYLVFGTELSYTRRIETDAEKARACLIVILGYDRDEYEILFGDLQKVYATDHKGFLNALATLASRGKAGFTYGELHSRMATIQDLKIDMGYCRTWLNLEGSFIKGDVSNSNLIYGRELKARIQEQGLFGRNKAFFGKEEVLINQNNPLPRIINEQLFDLKETLSGKRYVFKAAFFVISPPDQDSYVIFIKFESTYSNLISKNINKKFKEDELNEAIVNWNQVVKDCPFGSKASIYYLFERVDNI